LKNNKNNNSRKKWKKLLKNYHKKNPNSMSKNLKNKNYQIHSMKILLWKMSHQIMKKAKIMKIMNSTIKIMKKTMQVTTILNKEIEMEMKTWKQWN